MALIFQIFYILSLDLRLYLHLKKYILKQTDLKMHKDKSVGDLNNCTCIGSFWALRGGKKTTIRNKKAHFCSFVFSPAALLNYPLVPAAERISGCFGAEGQPRSSQRSGPLVLDFGPTESSYRVRVPFTSTHLTSAQHTPCLKGLPSGSRHRSVPWRKVANNGDEAHVVYCALSPSKL